MSSPARHRGWVAVLSGALAVGAILAAWMTEPLQGPERSAEGRLPYTISKETTWITEPLRPDGTVDFVAALNARLSEGVTPENNAAVLLMQVMGAGKIEEEIREEFYHHLGIPVPEKTAGALQSYGDFLDQQLKTNSDANTEMQREKLLEEYYETYGRPWTREEFPLVARWLEENQQAIDRIVAASQRPRLYVPVVPRDTESGLLDYMLEFNSNMREFARILSSRFMFSIGEGQIETAQRDLLALHRLASLMGSGSSVIDFLVSVALDGIAGGGDLEWAQSEHVTPAQLAEFRKEITELPPSARLSEMFGLRERYEYLDLIRILVMESGKSSAKMKNLAAEVGDDLGFPQAKVWKRFPDVEIQWDFVLKIINQRYNQFVAALNQPDFPQRKAALQELFEELNQLRRESLDAHQIELLITGIKPAREVISRQFGNELVFWSIRNSQSLAEVEVREILRRQMIAIALALAEYQHEHGSYPAELSELVPKYLSRIPPDAFTLEPLKYQPEKDSYLLYSVGPNGKDDKGVSDGGKADDIAIRIPKGPMT